jgi:hypothetical protein
MSLGFNFSSDSGEIIPIIKFNAKAGRMVRRDRVNGENDEVDITKIFKAVFDLENIEVGFINFDTGSAPDFAVARIGEGPRQRPSDKHKQGARILVRLAKDCGNDVRELASTAKSFLMGLSALHDAYEAGAKANPGKLPVVVLADPKPITTGEGTKRSTNYAPVFEIVSWVARPADLVFTSKGGAPTAPSRSETPPSTGSTKVSADDNVPGFDDGEDFG